MAAAEFEPQVAQAADGTKNKPKSVWVELGQEPPNLG